MTTDPLRQLRHDIKGCLNSLVLSAEVLADDLKPDEAVNFLAGMERAADRMMMLIDKLPASTDGDGQP